MFKLAESYQSTTGANVFGAMSPPELREQWPALAAVMEGIYSPDGKQCELPPCTVQLFCELGKLKFCLSPKTGNRIAFGSVSDPSKGMDGLERALQDGHFEWKNRGRKSS